jgi:hypothetical protein
MRMKSRHSTIAFLFCVLACQADFAKIVKDKNGVYWFEQNNVRFTSRVVNHVNNGGPDDGVNGRESVICQAATNNTLCGDSLNFGGALHYAPYWNVVTKKYNNSVPAWASAATGTLSSLGFNGVSGWSAGAAEAAAAARGMHSLKLLDIGVTWPYAWSKGLDFDVWSANFSEQVERIAAAVVPARANDESLLAWQTDNECNYMLLGLETYLVTYAASEGGAACVAWLQQRYPTLAALNAAWGSRAGAWTGPDGVGYHLQHDRGLNASAVGADNVDFIANGVMDRYFNLTFSAIRRHDPNHLISGLRGYFGDAALPVMLAAARQGVDLLDFHDYSDLPDVALMERAHQLTGLPIVNGEFSFTAVDSNMPNTHGARAGHPEPTQTDRARKFTAYATLLLSQPWAIGMGWWNWVDEPATGRWPDGENSNYGVISLADDTYTVLGDAFTAFNAGADALHAASGRRGDL